MNASPAQTETQQSKIQNLKSKIQSPRPDWENELELYRKGYTLIAGVDEVGRGAWAGPLVAGAVIFPPTCLMDWVERGENPLPELACLRDSKQLTPSMRESLLPCIRSAALAVGVGVVSSGLVDAIGVGPANRLAMARAIRELGVWPDFLLLDAFPLRAMPIPQRPIIRGDATCISIAAASVLAKVTRDRLMCGYDAQHPGYNFSQHKGYGTHDHTQALERLGVCPQHRRSYAPIKAIEGRT